MFRVAVVIVVAAAACARSSPRPAAPEREPAERCVAAEREPVALEPLEPAEGGVLLGTVVDDARLDALPGVTVLLVTTERPDLGSWSTSTARRGAYQVDPVPPGRYDVTFLFGDVELRVPAVELVAGRSRRLDVSLDLRQLGRSGWRVGRLPDRDAIGRRPGDSIVVVVVDERGEPLPGVRVMASGEAGRFEAWTERDGQAHLRWLRPGRYDVELAKDLMVDTWRDVTVEGGSRTILRVTLVAPQRRCR